MRKSTKAAPAKRGAAVEAKKPATSKAKAGAAGPAFGSPEWRKKHGLKPAKAKKGK